MDPAEPHGAEGRGFVWRHPLDVVCAHLLDETDALQDVGDVVDSPLPRLHGAQGCVAAAVCRVWQLDGSPGELGAFKRETDGAVQPSTGIIAFHATCSNGYPQYKHFDACNAR